jgi:hypothetical protein
MMQQQDQKRRDPVKRRDLKRRGLNLRGMALRKRVQRKRLEQKAPRRMEYQMTEQQRKQEAPMNWDNSMSDYCQDHRKTPEQKRPDTMGSLELLMKLVRKTQLSWEASKIQDTRPPTKVKLRRRRMGSWSNNKVRCHWIQDLLSWDNSRMACWMHLVLKRVRRMRRQERMTPGKGHLTLEPKMLQKTQQVGNLNSKEDLTLGWKRVLLRHQDLRIPQVCSWSSNKAYSRLVLKIALSKVTWMRQARPMR